MSLSKVTTLRHFFQNRAGTIVKLRLWRGQFAKSFTFRMRANGASKRENEKRCAKVYFWSRSRRGTSIVNELFLSVFRPRTHVQKIDMAPYILKNHFFKIDNAPYILKNLIFVIDMAPDIMKFLKIIDECIEDWAIDCAHSRTISPSTC